MRSRLIIPCDNRQIQQHLAQIGSAIAKLTVMGFMVDHLEIDGYQRPNIWVKDNPVCKQMQLQGQAALYGTTSTVDGKWEAFQMQIDNCRVVWRTPVKSNGLTSPSQAQSLTTSEAQ